MAEGFALARNEPDVHILSAGTQKTHVHPLVVKVMAEAGVDMSQHTSKTLDNLDSLEFDVVIALCSHAAEACPVMPGNPERVNWNLPNPDQAANELSDENAALDVFRKSRDEIKRLVDDLFDRGYLHALVHAKCCAEIIINNISDGIIAHDMNRRIFYFNQAAANLTGYSRDEVLNKDCHDVFPGQFCGAKCHFCDGHPPIKDALKQEVDIVTKSGEKRSVEMILKKLVDTDKHEIGVLVSFKDVTQEHRLARQAGKINSFSGIIGHDHKMLEVFDMIRDLADSNAPVLVQGESGTGKELVAAAIHNEGLRANKLFVPVNCAALPEALLESELFGHVKGAFTGAIRDKKGRFELADGGTIFLDEIGDIPPAMQVKLLRVLQEGTFERVGSEQTTKVDVRLISATNKDLMDEIEAGTFRDDLYYRLSVVPLTLPPLRVRRNDIPILAKHILKQELERSEKPEITISPEAMDIMISYDWPGNVRELQNWIQFSLVKCRNNMIKPEHLPPRRGKSADDTALFKKQRRKKLETSFVREALRETGGNKLEAARLLGVSRATLYRFLDDTNIDL
ncbi:MAG: sigma 54-interacting transcriptional regulator [Kiritimatiellae bacterium]|nr:sigma 54-interacting transcriptional regulator [Kiritimatiellia bacterium]